MNPQGTLPQNTQSAPPMGAANGLDPQVMNLAKAIRDVESQGNYTAQGKSGEFGAYQFTQPTWDSVAPSILGQNVPLAQASPLQQNAVAYHYIKGLQDKGYNAGQIASIWNSGRSNPNGNVGTNSSGAAYDTPSYVNNVYQKYLMYKDQGGQPQQPEESGAIPGLPTYGATFPYHETDNPLVAPFKFLGNVPSSVYGFGEGVASMLMHPLATAESVGSAALGGIDELTGQQPNQNTQSFDTFAHALKQRYGSVDALINTVINDPAGFAADVGTFAYPALGAAGKTGEAANLIDKVGGAVVKPISKAVGNATSLPFRLLGATDEDALAAASRQGLLDKGAPNLPSGAYTSSPLVHQLESLAASGAGGEAMATRIEAATENMQRVAKTIVESTKGSEDLESAGRAIASGLGAYEKEFRATSNALFDGVKEKAGNIAAQTTNSQQVLNQLIADKEAVADTANIKFFKDKYAVLTGGKIEGDLQYLKLDKKGRPIMPEGKQYAPPTFDTLKRLRTNVGEMIDTKFQDPFVKQNFGQLKRLYRSLSQDMEATINSTRDKNLIRLYKQANATYAAGRAEITSQFAKTIRRFTQNGQYSKIANYLTRPATAIEDIPRVMALVGEEGAANIRSIMVRKILDAGQNAEHDFTPQGINRAIKRYGDDKIGAILEPKQVQGLKDLGTLSSALGRALKTAQGSQTAFLLRAQAEVGALGVGAYALFTGNLPLFINVAGGLLGEQALSYFIASPTGQRALMWGITHGTEYAASARAAGLTPPPESGTLGTHGNNTDIPPSGGLRVVPGGDTPGGTGGVAGRPEGGTPPQEGAVPKLAPEAGQAPADASLRVAPTKQEVFNMTPEEATTAFRQLFDENEAAFAVRKDLFNEGGFPVQGYTKTSKELFTDQYKTMVKLLESDGKVSDKTLYHEAFHAYFSRFLSQAERDGMLTKVQSSILAGAQKLYPDEVYGTAAKKAEEWLADDFAKYVAGAQTYDGFFRNVWEKVLNGLRSLVRRSTGAQELYDKILGKERPQQLPVPMTEATAKNGELKPFPGFSDTTTKILEDLKGRTSVSKQYLLDATNRPELKQAERDIIRKVLDEFPSQTISAETFANRVKSELLPLERTSLGEPRYENVALPSDERGAVANYSEHVYESPIKTSAGNVHFGGRGRPGFETTGNYFAHSRVEDLPGSERGFPKDSEIDNVVGTRDGKYYDANGSTRRVIELQSDLFQKGNLEKEANNLTTSEIADALSPEEAKKYKVGVSLIRNGGAESAVRDAEKYVPELKAKAVAKLQPTRDAELAKLEPYRNIWHERVIREELKAAAKDGKTTVQFPTGETAMKIEGLYNRNDKWVTLDNELVDGKNIKEGDIITYQNHEGLPHEDRRFLITKTYDNGTFDAVDSMTAENDFGFHELMQKKDLLDDGRLPTLEELQSHLDKESMDYLSKLSERLSAQDIVDTNSPIYKFYEKEVGRYLKNKYGAERVTDPQGASWWQVKVDKKLANEPVEAFQVGSPTVESTRQAVENSLPFDIDGAIKNGDMKASDIYESGKILKPKWAEGRVNDVALKLDNLKPGLGQVYKDRLEGIAGGKTYKEIVGVGEEVLDDFAKGRT